MVTAAPAGSTYPLALPHLCPPAPQPSFIIHHSSFIISDSALSTQDLPFHAFIPVNVIPCTKYFCAQKNTAITGIVMMIDPAIIIA
jgi:hypothetical protein